MSTPNTARIIWLLVFTVALTMISCSRKVQILWFNDTGDTVSIFVVDLRKARPDATIKAGGNAITPDRPPIIIQTQTQAWLYDDLPLSEGLATRDAARLCKIWIRQDGLLYYLPPTATGPTNGFIWQPRGFPVKPRPILRKR